MFFGLKYLFMFLCYLIFLPGIQCATDAPYLLLIRIEQTSSKPAKEWKIPLTSKKDIAFFRYLTKKKGKKLEKEGHWHPWLGRTCAVVLLKNGKQTGSVLYIANYDCEPKHCWFYFVEEPNGKSSWSRFLKNNDIAKRRYYGFQNEKVCKYFWNFIKKLNSERMIFKPVGEKSKMQRR